MSTEAATHPLADTAPEPGVGKPDAILTVDGLHRAFGGVAAVDVDHLEVERNTITSLIGPNGAGKTTLFNLLTGFDRPDHGDWVFDGTKIHRRVLAYRMPRKGMVRTFQLTKVLARLTVLENMLLGNPHQPGERLLASMLPFTWRGQEAEATERADDLLGRFNLTHMRGEQAGTLSGGQRKLLEMARALMVEPRMLMLDEPMAGVNPALRQTIAEHIVELRDGGLSVLFIEHDMDVVMQISDWIIVLAQGQVIAEGRPGDIAANTDVIDAYLGRHDSGAEPQGDSRALGTTPGTPPETPPETTRDGLDAGDDGPGGGDDG